MKQKRLNLLSWFYLGGALCSLVICVWDVIVLGLFAPAVDMTRGIGVAMVCTLGELAITALLVLIGLEMRKRFTAKTFKMMLLLFAGSLFTLIFCLLGEYVVIPPLAGMLLPAVTLLCLR